MTSHDHRPVLGMHKPIIGMVHLPALPGSPYAKGMSRNKLLDAAKRDLDALLEAGFDAISISNEADRPYLTTAPSEVVALFTWLASELTRDLSIPFGCGLLIDPLASLAVARAIGARFVRTSHTIEVGAFGVVTQSPAEILRYRQAIGATDVALLTNYSPHFSTSLDSRDAVEIARTYAALCPPDAIQVPGAGAGSAPSLETVAAVRAAVPAIPVLVASGVTADSVAAALDVADGIIVGTWLKRDGYIYGAVDPERARRFMDQARAARDS